MSVSHEVDEVLHTLHHVELENISLGLERTHALMELLGNPHTKLPPVIHVAGTNGKGSTIAYLQGVFENAGLRAHRYTSPHLVRFNERIVLSGKPIADSLLLSLLHEVKAACVQVPVTFFEATTALAFLAFSREPADILLLEVGLGGRLDATNVIDRPLATVITPISRDHMEYLGETLREIAFEKAGIIKPHVPCIVAPQEPDAMDIIEEVATTLNSPLMRYGTEWTVESVNDQLACFQSNHLKLKYAPSLQGKHQFINAATAIACIDTLPPMGISNEQVRLGVSAAKWPARLQQLHQGTLVGALPKNWELWLDGGHNASAGLALSHWAKMHGDKPLMLICGMIRGKETEAFLRPLAPYVSKLIGINIPQEEATQDATAIANAAHAAGIEAAVATTLQEALFLCAQSDTPHARVLICGSLYLAGKVLYINGIN